MKDIRKLIREKIANARLVQDLDQLVREVEEYDRVQGTTSWRDNMLKDSSRFRFRAKEAELIEKDLSKITSLAEANKFYFFKLPGWSSHFVACAEKVASYYSNILEVMQAYEEIQAPPLREALLKRWNAVVIEQLSHAESIGAVEKLFFLAPPHSEAQRVAEKKWEQIAARNHL